MRSPACRVFALLLLCGLMVAVGALGDCPTPDPLFAPWRMEYFPALACSLGVSGGNELDFNCRADSVFCCSGTLGALVLGPYGKTYVLSNNHVIDRSNNGLVKAQMTAGDVIHQPGFLDCACDTGQAVANLAFFTQIIWKVPNANVAADNTIDAALAEVGNPSAFVANGAIVEIGPVAGSPLGSPTMSLPVKKSGRTTGLTHGTINMVNSTIDVDYNVPCGSTSSKTAHFINALAFNDAATPFSDEGDSGALVVEDVTSCPRAVALLFARTKPNGGSPLSFGNPIPPVFQNLGITFFVHGACPADPVNAPMDLALSHAIDVHTRAAGELSALPGVVGSGVGVDAGKQYVIQILLERDSPEIRSRLPAQVEDIPTRVLITGRIIAQ